VGLRGHSSTTAIRVKHLHKTEVSGRPGGAERFVRLAASPYGKVRKMKLGKRRERCVTSCFVHGLGVFELFQMQ